MLHLWLPFSSVPLSHLYRGCDLPDVGAGNRIQIFLQEQCVLSMAKPSLQPKATVFKTSVAHTLNTTYIFCLLFLFLFFNTWTPSQIHMSFLCRGHANLFCIAPILAYVLPNRAGIFCFSVCFGCYSPLTIARFALS